jgi:hypothetical protein
MDEGSYILRRLRWKGNVLEFHAEKYHHVGGSSIIGAIETVHEF